MTGLLLLQCLIISQNFRLGLPVHAAGAAEAAAVANQQAARVVEAMKDRIMAGAVEVG